MYVCSQALLFDCQIEGVNWQHTWSSEHQRYCCYLRQIGCHTKAQPTCLQCDICDAIPFSFMLFIFPFRQGAAVWNL